MRARKHVQQQQVLPEVLVLVECLSEWIQSNL
jgi:hypothetical protein